MKKATGVLEFEFRTGKVTINYAKCKAPDCGFACVKADRYYGRNILKIDKGRPVLAVSKEEAKRLCNECLACEIHCRFSGNDAVQIDLPLPGLDQYRSKYEKI
jgi:hypothetical protein